MSTADNHRPSRILAPCDIQAWADHVAEFYATHGRDHYDHEVDDVVSAFRAKPRATHEAPEALQ